MCAIRVSARSGSGTTASCFAGFATASCFAGAANGRHAPILRLSVVVRLVSQTPQLPQRPHELTEDRDSPLTAEAARRPFDPPVLRSRENRRQLGLQTLDLVSLTDIAKLLGMTRGGADKLVKREATFPPPVAVLSGRTRAWDRDAVENWARESGRLETWDAGDDAQLRRLIRRSHRWGDPLG